jgi:hypothetical protein
MPRKNIPTYIESERITQVEDEAYTKHRAPRIDVSGTTSNAGAIVAEGLSKIGFMFEELNQKKEDNTAMLEYMKQKNNLQKKIDEQWMDMDANEHVDAFNREHDIIDQRVLGTIKNSVVKRKWSQQLKQERLGWEPSVRSTGRKREIDVLVGQSALLKDGLQNEYINARNQETRDKAAAAIWAENQTLYKLGAIGYEEAVNDTETRMDHIQTQALEKWVEENWQNGPIDTLFKNPVYLEADADIQLAMKNKYLKLIKSKDTAEDLAEKQRKERWRIGDNKYTTMLLANELETKHLVEALSRDDIRPETARTLQNALDKGEPEDNPDVVRELNRMIATNHPDTQDKINEAYNLGHIKTSTRNTKINVAMNEDIKDIRSKITRKFNPDGVALSFYKKQLANVQYQAANDFDALVHTTNGDPQKMSELATSIINKYNVGKIEKITSVDSKEVEAKRDKYQQEYDIKLNEILTLETTNQISEDEAKRRFEKLERDHAAKIYGLE